MHWPAVFIAVAALGCKGGGEDEVPVGSSDVRIDGGGEDDANADGTRLCATVEGRVHVVWSEPRNDGPSVVLYNGSPDGGQSWNPAATQLSHGEGDAVTPDVACEGDGVWVVWEDTRDGELDNHNVYFNRSEDGGYVWQEEDLALDDDEDGRNMSLGARVVQADGDVYAAWFDSRNGAYDVLVAGSSNGGESFEEPVRADGDDPGSAYSAWPQLAADGSGNVYVAWEDSRDEGNDVYFARSNDHAFSFRDDQRLDGGDDPGEHDSFSPRLAVEGTDMVVVWHDERSGDNRDVFGNASDDQGESWWEDAEILESDSPGFYDSLYPVVVLRDDVLHVAWQDARNQGFDVYYRNGPIGSFAAEEVRLDVGTEKGVYNSTDPVLAVDGGAVAVAWRDGRDDIENEGYTDLYYNWSDDGGATFHTADYRVDSVEAGKKYTRDLNLALHDGHVLLAWTDGRDGDANVYFHRLKLGDEAEYVPLDE